MWFYDALPKPAVLQWGCALASASACHKMRFKEQHSTFLGLCTGRECVRHSFVWSKGKGGSESLAGCHCGLMATYVMDAQK